MFETSAQARSKIPRDKTYFHIRRQGPDYFMCKLYIPYNISKKGGIETNMTVDVIHFPEQCKLRVHVVKTAGFTVQWDKAKVKGKVIQLHDRVVISWRYNKTSELPFEIIRKGILIDNFEYQIGINFNYRDHLPEPPK